MGDTVSIRCHCGQFQEKVQLRESIPVDNLLCQCDSCRHVTGALTLTGLSLLQPPVEAFRSGLARYSTSEKLERHFCATCGSHVCYYIVQEDRWSACAGAVDGVSEDKRGHLEKMTALEFVDDAVDGGLAVFFPEATLYRQEVGGSTVGDIKAEAASSQNDKKLSSAVGDTLRAACHCGQVDFSISRPDESDVNSKWEAGICVCRSCRLSLGQPIIPWAFNIPFAKARWSDGTIHQGDLHASLKRFQSSDHAYRDFCSKCGANVFYYSSRQPGQLDVAFGILRSDDGSLAKSWFNWDTKKIHYPEDAVDEDLVNIVREKLKDI